LLYQQCIGYGSIPAEGAIYFLDKTSDVLEILDTTAFAVVFLFVNFLNKTNVFEKILHGFCTAIFLKNNTLHLGHSGVIPGMSFFFSRLMLYIGNTSVPQLHKLARLFNVKVEDIL